MDAISRLPDTPYKMDIPYSSIPEASAPRTKYFIAASEARAVAIKSNQRIQRQGQQFQTKINGQQLCRRDHHHHAEHGEQPQHVVFALEQLAVLQIAARYRNAPR